MEIVSSSLAKTLSELRGRDFISCSDFTPSQIQAIHELSSQLKKGDRRIDLGNRVLGLVFSKASTRTRVSFQVAMTRLGGQTIDLSSQTSQISRGESLKDTARVLSRYCDALAIRTYENDELMDYANWASIPVINALTDLYHPCQALADFLTVKENFGTLDGINLSYVGDGNNVANSLMICGALLGVNITVACPKGFEPKQSITEKARSIAGLRSKVNISHDPVEAVKGANVIYTDVWASMGQESEQQEREKAFKGFMVDQSLLERAEIGSIILHCLPAHRGEEISEEVLEGSASRVFDQAENRLHVQHALLAVLLGGV